MKRRQKAGSVSPRSSKITLTKEKERRRRKSEEKRKKAMVALLVFIMATLKIVFGRKKLLDVNGPFVCNLFKNPARYFIYYNFSFTMALSI